LALSFSFHFSLGQEKNFKNELGFSFLKISTLPFEYKSDYPNTFNLGFNAIYKRKISKSFYARANQSYYKYDFKKSLQNVNGDYKIQEINSSLGIKFRYLKTKSNKLNLFAGMDITGFINFNQYSSPIPGWIDKTKRTGLGINPFTGINIYPLKRMVISLEASFLKGFYKDKVTMIKCRGSIKPNLEDKGSQPFSQLFFLRTASIGWVF